MTVAEPELAEMVPANTPRSVDLPEPLGPITASEEAVGISIVTSLNATFSSYVTWRSVVEMADGTAPE